jgi:hypothetical protein
MIFKTVTALALRLVRQVLLLTRRNAPFIVASTCQSEIKRTLRRAIPRPKTVSSRGFRRGCGGSFDADGERQVSNARLVWFRKGGCGRYVGPSRTFGHQSKIYTESNQSGFSRIFGVLSSMQTLAIYRRLVVRGLIARATATVARSIAGVCVGSQRQQDRRPGSRDVFSAPHDLLARAGARAAAPREDAGG